MSRPQRGSAEGVGGMEDRISASKEAEREIP